VASAGPQLVAGSAAVPVASDLTPLRAVARATGGEGSLVDRVSALIEQARSFVASQANATLTLRNWHIGRMIDVEVLDEGRAGHDEELVASLAQQLTNRFGRGFDRTNLYRMVRFSQQFPDVELVASLAQQVLPKARRPNPRSLPQDAQPGKNCQLWRSENKN